MEKYKKYFKVGRERYKHPVKLGTSLYVCLPWFLLEEYNFGAEAEVEYKRGNDEIVIKIKGGSE